jgi:hypothetical protein
VLVRASVVAETVGSSVYAKGLDDNVDDFAGGVLVREPKFGGRLTLFLIAQVLGSMP